MQESYVLTLREDQGQIQEKNGPGSVEVRLTYLDGLPSPVLYFDLMLP